MTLNCTTCLRLTIINSKLDLSAVAVSFYHINVRQPTDFLTDNNDYLIFKFHTKPKRNLDLLY